MDLYLRFNSYCTDTSTVAEDEAWDRPNTTTERNFLTVCQHRRESRPTCNYELFSTWQDFKSGDTIHLVIVEYSTGDSFGHDENSNFEIISAHKEYKFAEIMLNSVLNQEGHVVKCRTDDGETYETGFAPWSGYFESIYSSNIHTFMVQ